MACFTDFELTYNASNFVLRPWVWLSLVATKSGRPPSLFNQLHRNVYFTNIKWIRSYFSLSSLLSLHLARIRLPSQPRLWYKRGTELGANVCCQWWRLVRSDLDRGVPAHYRCELTQTLRSCCCFLYMCILGLMHRSNAPPAFNILVPSLFLSCQNVRVVVICSKPVTQKRRMFENISRAWTNDVIECGISWSCIHISVHRGKTVRFWYPAGVGFPFMNLTWTRPSNL